LPFSRRNKLAAGSDSSGDGEQGKKKKQFNWREHVNPETRTM